METIETPKEYNDLIKTSRDPPFLMVESANNFVYDFDKIFRKKVTIPQNLKIKHGHVIHYSPDSSVSLY